MQYSKCAKCVHNGNVCKMVMAEAIYTISSIERLINYSQTKDTNHKCQLKIDYSCENFTPKYECIYTQEIHPCSKNNHIADLEKIFKELSNAK